MAAADRVRPTTLEHIRRLYDSPDVYPMTSPRGRVLIINNEAFDDAVNPDQGCLDDRLGSEYDLHNLERIFEELDFVFTVASDVSSQRILNLVKDETRHPDHEKYGMFVLVVLSHGDEGVVYGSDSRKVSINDIIRRLSVRNFPAMADRPKVVIIQACAGGESDNRVYQDQADGSDSFKTRGEHDNTVYKVQADGSGSSKTRGDHDAPEATKSEVQILKSELEKKTVKEELKKTMVKKEEFKEEESEVVSIADTTMTSLNIQEDSRTSAERPRIKSSVADLIILQASFPGYKSLRHTFHGTFMIQALVEILRRFACHDHFSELIVKVRKRVLEMCEEFRNDRLGAQTVHCAESLLKKLYLFPGMSGPNPGDTTRQQPVTSLQLVGTGSGSESATEVSSGPELPKRSEPAVVSIQLAGIGSISGSESAPEATNEPELSESCNGAAAPTVALPEPVTPTSSKETQTFPTPVPRSIRTATPSVPVPVARTAISERRSMPVPAPRASILATQSIPVLVTSTAARENESIEELVTQAVTKATEKIPELVTQAVANATQLMPVTQSATKGTQSIPVPATRTKSVATQTDPVPEPIAPFNQNCFDYTDNINSFQPEAWGRKIVCRRTNSLKFNLEDYFQQKYNIFEWSLFYNIHSTVNICSILDLNDLSIA